MGANYDMLVVSSADRPAVIGAVRDFLAQNGFRIVRQATTRRSTKELKTGDDVVFIGPGSSWIPLAWQAPGQFTARGAWFSNNALAIHLSERLGVAIFLWSLDSGVVCGYSVYENGSLTESQVRFCGQHDEELDPGVPTPPTVENGRLAWLLNDKSFDYQRFLSEADSLETATGVLASRFGLEAHLVDASSAVEGEPADAIVNGEYEAVDMARWTAILYEREQDGVCSLKGQR